MAGIDDFLDYWESLTGVGLSVAKYQNSKELAQFNIDSKILAQNKAIQADKVKADYALRKSVLIDTFEDNEGQIDDLLDDLETWTVNGRDHFKLPDKYQTDEGKQLLTSRGVEIGENLDVRYGIADESLNTLDNLNLAIQVQDAVSDDLTTQLNSIKSMQPYLNDVQRDAGIKTVKDIEDFKLYMENNPNLFPQEKPYLGQAFTSGKMLKLGEPYEKEAVALATAKKQLEILEGKGDRKAASSARKAYEVQTNDLIRLGFNKIGSIEADAKFTELLTKSDGVKVGVLKGDQDAFTDPVVAKYLKQSVEDNILKLIKNNIEPHRWGDIHRLPYTDITRIDNVGDIVNRRNGTSKEKALSVFQLYQMIMPVPAEIETVSEDGTITTNLVPPAHITGSGLNNTEREVDIGIPMYPGESTGSQKINMEGFRDLDIDLAHGKTLGELFGFDVPGGEEASPIGEQGLVEYLRFWHLLNELHPSLKLDYIEGYHDIMAPLTGQKINPYFLINQGIDLDSSIIDINSLSEEELLRLLSESLQTK